MRCFFMDSEVEGVFPSYLAADKTRDGRFRGSTVALLI